MAHRSFFAIKFWASKFLTGTVVVYEFFGTLLLLGSDQSFVVNTALGPSLAEKMQHILTLKGETIDIEIPQILIDDNRNFLNIIELGG